MSVQSMQLVIVKVPSPFVLDSNTVSAEALDAAPTDRSKLPQTARTTATKNLLTFEMRVTIMIKIHFPLVGVLRLIKYDQSRQRNAVMVQ